MVTVPWPKWPKRTDQGRYRIACSCQRWEFTGTAEEVYQASLRHEDSPFRKHIVSIRERIDL